MRGVAPSMAGGTSNFLGRALPIINSHQTDLTTKWSIMTLARQLNCPCPIEYQLTTPFPHPRRNCGGNRPRFVGDLFFAQPKIC